MSLGIDELWSDVRRVGSRGQESTICCSAASINPDATPNSSLSRNLDLNPKVCAMAVNFRFFCRVRQERHSQCKASGGGRPRPVIDRPESASG